MSSTVLGTALPALVAHADPTTLYVNNFGTCSDSGSGAQSLPFCTVQAAANAAQPGQTVLLVPNSSFPEQVTVTHSGTPGSPITFRAMGAQDGMNAVAKIGVTASDPKAQSLPHGFVLSGVHDVTVSGLYFATPQEAVLVQDSDRIVLDGNQFQGAGSLPASPAPAVRLTGKTTASTVSRNFFRGAGTASVAVDAGVTGAVVTTNLMNAGQGPGVLVTDAPGTAVTGNSVIAGCHGGITLAGNSAGSSVENNVITESSKSSCPTQPDLSVSAASITGTTADYNVVAQAAQGVVVYAWGAGTYATPAAFATASGQGGHDLTNNFTSVFPGEGWVGLDSADANAPGEPATDFYGNPRVDDPKTANTGTGVGSYDRGAFELQDPLNVMVNAQSHPVLGTPLNASISTYVSGTGWGPGPVTWTLDFGDGSPKQTSPGYIGTTNHYYQNPGTYTLTLTANDGIGSRTATTSVVIPEANPPQPTFAAGQADDAVPTLTFSPGGPSSWAIVKYVLDFGDGSPKLETTPSAAPFPHTFPGPGTYTVTMTAIDDHGLSGTTSRSVDVADLLQMNRTIETVENGWLHEVIAKNGSDWPDTGLAGVSGGNVSALSFQYSPSGARVIEAVEYGGLHEVYSAADGWHDGQVGAGASVVGGISALSFSYSPSGARVIEAVESGQLHEIYSAADGWHDGIVPTGGNISALSFSYSPSGARVIEAIEGGVLHEIYSAADGWHDNAITGVAPDVSAMSFAYNQAGQRVIEAVEGGVLHEVYSDVDGWHDSAVSGAGSNINNLSVKIRPTGDRVIEAVEGNTMHEIYTNAGSWLDSITAIGHTPVSAVALALP